MEDSSHTKAAEIATPPRSSLADLFLRISTHSVSLVLASVASFILWMPYGFGYYDFPWEQPLAVDLLLAFVIIFPVSAAVALARSFRPQFLPVRFGTSILSLLIGLHGLLHMLHWWFRFWLLPH